jgi:tetratricopeptide (TPR) repeat protein
MLLDLLDHVVDLSRGAPILLLCAARPWLLEDRPGWAGGRFNVTTLLLEPLGAADCGVLLEQIGAALPPEAQARIVAASQGNPLFLEEMVALARERSTVEVPSTIQALLAARVERLAREEREILETGAVEGEIFHKLSVRVLASQQVSSDVGPRLAALVRKDLVRPQSATFFDADASSDAEAYRFRHLLLRDAVYDALTKGTRAELHERFGRWLEQSDGAVLDLAELAGWHLGQAVLYRRQLNQVVDRTLVFDAASRLHAAGERARERGDAAAAVKLFERALALAPDDRPLSVRIAVDLAEQLIEIGDLALADELLSMAEADPAGSEQAALTRFEWLIRVKPHEATRTIESELPGILVKLARVSDERGIAKAHMAAFWVHMLASRPEPAGVEARLAAEHALQVGDMGLRSWALGWYIVTMVYGRQDADTIAHELDLIEQEELGPYLAARVDFGRGELARLEGRFTDARRLTARAIEGFQALGIPALDACGQQELARTELSAGVPCAALAPLLHSDALLSALGERLFRSATQALVAQVHERLGNRDAALAALGLADQLCVPGDVLTYVTADGVRARLALADGDHEAAERWARSAVAHAFQTDYIVFEATAKLDLARVLSALGRVQEATSEARAALDAFMAKGDRPGASQARALLAEVSVPA